MFRITSVLLLAVVAVGMGPSSADACWLCRHHGAGSGYGGVSGVSSVAGIQSIQTVQTVPTFAAVAAMPMVVASPMAVYGGAVYGASGIQVAGGVQNTRNIPSSEVAEVKANIAGVQQEIQSLRSELVGTLIREFLIPLASKVIDDRLGLPSPGPGTGQKKCGCENGGSQNQGKTGMEEPTGAFGPSSVNEVASDNRMGDLITKLDELIVVLKSERDGKTCEKCKAAEATDSNPPAPPAAEARMGRSANRLTSHRRVNRIEAGNAATLDAKLGAIQRKNDELLQRLKALQGT